MLLTEQGEIVWRYARRVLALRVEMVNTLRGSSTSGEARVGFVQDFTDNVLPLAIQRFSALYLLANSRWQLTCDRRCCSRLKPVTWMSLPLARSKGKLFEC